MSLRINQIPATLIVRRNLEKSFNRSQRTACKNRVTLKNERRRSEDATPNVWVVKSTLEKG